MARRSVARMKKKSNTGAVVIGSLAIGLSIGLAAVIVFFVYKAMSRPPLDKVTMCPENGPRQVTALLVDTTDPISIVTLADLKNRFSEVVQSTEVGEMLAIYGLTEKRGELITMFEGCNPGDESTVDQWTGNKKIQQRKWEEVFGKPMEEVRGKLDKGQAGAQSPIMAAIQNIKLQVFDRFKERRDEASGEEEKIPKKLIVVSDMIEHTALYSQYKSDLEFQNYKDSPANADYRTSLDGAEVSIWFVDRGIEKFSDAKFMNFWATWVMDNRGTWGSAIRLEGVSPQSPSRGNT